MREQFWWQESMNQTREFHTFCYPNPVWQWESTTIIFKIEEHNNKKTDWEEDTDFNETWDRIYVWPPMWWEHTWWNDDSTELPDPPINNNSDNDNGIPDPEKEIEHGDGQTPRNFRLINEKGQLVKSYKQSFNRNKNIVFPWETTNSWWHVTTMQIPSNIADWIYFIRIEWVSKPIKIVVGSTI